ncbi:hypothetical protein [Alicyclobacillus shizuokensis]|uniref:hypothetical protein n=1 Tax=Alicyclobacillus shizuokensis TaxID=392014 RepID=UPI0008369AAE|nr:hypothetical protein [Alicyclobacillus shizuokensis]MCL6626046.1 hypothetical protein [Alicyclobacillus shizuokensis]
MYELRRCMVRIERLLAPLLMLPPPNYNPLHIQLRTIVEEEVETIHRRALPALEQVPVDIASLRYAIEVVYRADEVAQPTVRDWVRASLWMHSASVNQLIVWKRSLKFVFRELEKMVPAVQRIYGELDTRYIVPPEYRRQREV